MWQGLPERDAQSRASGWERVAHMHADTLQPSQQAELLDGSTFIQEKEVQLSSRRKKERLPILGYLFSFQIRTEV